MFAPTISLALGLLGLAQVARAVSCVEGEQLTGDSSLIGKATTLLGSIACVDPAAVTYRVNLMNRCVVRRARVRRCDVVEIRRAHGQAVQTAVQQAQRGVRGAA